MVATSNQAAFNWLLTLKPNDWASFKNAATSKSSSSSVNDTMAACLIAFSDSIGFEMFKCNRNGFLTMMDRVVFHLY